MCFESRRWHFHSQLGIDYAPLKELLAKGEFEKADDFTRAVLITMVSLGGEGFAMCAR